MLKTIRNAVALLWIDVRYVLMFLLPIKLHVLWHQLAHGGRFSVVSLWRRSVRRWPGKVALVFHGTTYSFGRLDELARRAARALDAPSLAPGMRVAISGENEPAFLWHALALLEMGCVPVIVRPTLSESDLLAYLAGYERLPLLVASEHTLRALPDAVRARFAAVRAWHPDGADLRGLDPVPAAALAARRADATLWSEVFHIGTSNTSGASKACVEHHGSILGFILGHAYMKGLTPADRVYTTATLSHGEGFAVGALVPWAIGASVCLDDRFDPDRYFENCQKNDVTVISYVDTMPRRLLATPPGPADRTHRVRVASGHEMLETCWREFQTRFGIPRVVEYFAATEGTFFFKNEEWPGAVGVLGPLGTALFPFVILKVDDDGELTREHGLPVRCARGEVGELFGAIDAADPLSLSRYADARLDGPTKYADLLAPGDRWHRSGDLVRHDPDGRVYWAGKRGVAFRNAGTWVNPQVVEDKLAGGRLPFAEVLAFCVRRGGRRAPALRVKLAAPMAAEPLFAGLAEVLDPAEVPELVVLDEAPCTWTASLRRRRNAPVLDEAGLRAEGRPVLVRPGAEIDFTYRELPLSSRGAVHAFAE